MHTTILEIATRFAQATTEPEFDPDTVTPGVWGFVLTAVVAVAVVGLGFDMIRRIRRTNYKAEIGARLQAEIAERDAAANAANAGNPGDSDAAGADDAPAAGPDTK